jgi:hypothetical protein
MRLFKILLAIKRKIILNNKNAEILILGNSHTYFGLNPNKFKIKAINISNRSRKIETDYLILKKHIVSLKKLKHVIIPISFYSMFANELSEKEKRMYYQFFKLEYYDQGSLNNSFVLNNSLKNLINDFNDTNRQDMKISKLGFRFWSNNFKPDTLALKERLITTKVNTSNKIVFFKNLTYLQKIVDIGINFNVKIWFLFPPYHSDFYKMDTNNYIQEIKKTIIVLQEKKIGNLITNYQFLKNENELFKDADHLNLKGANFLTKKIDSIIQF